MAPFTSNYETIKETSSKDKSLDLTLTSGDMTTPSQGKIQSTFLQSVLSNKFAVAFVVVLLGTGLMAYNANPVPPASQFRLGDYAAIVDDSKGGGITGTESAGCNWYIIGCCPSWFSCCCCCEEG
mmetsp:Transcript_63543/g.71031  ORF Transcript_63543/g.71031 Transcript_63543/m.71031 type:complete len:125 (-) Transcript_63543:89-463(-)